MSEIRVIKRVGHLPRPTVVYEWQCPPNCPDCARERHEPTLTTTYNAEGITKQQLPLAGRIGNIYCATCNRWGDHDETANHG